jgi:hypothetical protein
LTVVFIQAAAYQMNQEFAPVLSERMSFYSNDPSADTLGRVKVCLWEALRLNWEAIHS